VDWLTGLKYALALLFKLADLWFEKNTEKSKQKAEAIHEAVKGLDERDPSAVTAALDRLRRLR